MAGELVTVELSRFSTTQPWGFRLKGGKEHGMPIFVEQASISHSFDMFID